MVEVSAPFFLQTKTPTFILTSGSKGTSQNIQPLLKSLVPHLPQHPPPPSVQIQPVSLAQHPSNLLPPPPSQIYVVPPRTPNLSGSSISSSASSCQLMPLNLNASQTGIEEDEHPSPLDLTCKPPLPVFDPQEAHSWSHPTIHPRSGSCSSTTSSKSGCGEDMSVRRLKRKEQNKTAAQHYRQRKKSFSDFIETEHDELFKKNSQLKAHKNKLEEQIAKIRNLLDDVVKEEKKEPVVKAELPSPPPPPPPQALVKLTHPPTAAAAFLPDVPLPMKTHMDIDPGNMSDSVSEPLRGASALERHNDFMEEEGFGRARKYTWPSTLTSKDRKKEQNRMASQRFRHRRKLEQSISETEVYGLESNNKKLKKKCEEMEGKVKLLQELISKHNASLGGNAKPVNIASLKAPLPAPILVAKPSTTLSLPPPISLMAQAPTTNILPSLN